MGNGALRVLVIGSSGQVARALALRGVEFGAHILCRGRPEADLTDEASLAAAIDADEPAAVVNAAAFTAVDRAESEPDAAFALNADGPARLARLCAARRLPLLHVSTDYVFDGSKGAPYVETDPVAPLNVYGASKAHGEAAVRAALDRHIVLRTAWVYSEQGHNFLRTMLRLGAEREEVAVVDDQRGAPTCAHDVAAAILAMLKAPRWGTYHFVNAGEATWHGFAAEIFRLAAGRGLPTPRLRAIATVDYPTPARRPACSLLDTARLRADYGIRPAHWRDSLAACFDRLSAVGSGVR